MSKSQFPFGQAGSNNSTNIFGSTSNASSGPASSSIFTATTQAGSIFGTSSSSTPATSTANPFANIGGLNTTSLSGQTGSGGSNTFGNTWNFPPKPDEGTGGSGATNSIFPTPGTPSTLGAGQSSIFSSTNISTSAPSGSTTPATSKPGSLFNFAPSMTPTGLPPAADSSTGTKTAATVALGSGLFSGQKPAGSTTQPASPAQQSASLFGANTASSSSGLFASLKVPTPGGSLFNSSNNSKSASNADTATSSGSTTLTSKPPFGFPSSSTAAPQQATTSSPFNFGTTSNTNSTTMTSTALPQSTGVFGNLATSTAQTQSMGALGTAPTSTALTQPTVPFGGSKPTSSSPSLFSGLGKSTGPTTAVTTSSNAPATTSAPMQTTNVFSSFNKSTSLAASTPVTAPTISASPSSGLFGNVGSSTSTAAPTTAPTTAPSTTSTAAPATASTANGLGASTTAPLGISTAGQAPQLSRLKNKTMDEIITRWAGDLSNYQKEFQEQATKVASWDRLLVENGEKIQKLYNSTFEAERASAAVERQLTNVESQQDELCAWLDRFEGDVDRLMADQIGQGEALQGPDQEREHTYRLAEKLAERLDEMGKDLSNMIEEINSASTSLTKTSQPEDPISQIVKVLNGHLSQLQWIDQNAAALQAKVTAAQKAGQGISTNGQAENGVVDDFYRSYIGKR